MSSGSSRQRVSVTLPGHVAHGLAHVLAGWSTIAEMMESGRRRRESSVILMKRSGAASATEQRAVGARPTRAARAASDRR
jgi:hypothetical protein